MSFADFWRLNDLERRVVELRRTHPLLMSMLFTTPLPWTLVLTKWSEKR